MSRVLRVSLILAVAFPGPSVRASAAGEDWTQFKLDARHSGNAPDRTVSLPLGLVAAVPLTDAVFTSPVVADGRIHVVDGSGVAFGIDEKTFQILWRTPTQGGLANCNNVSSPAVVDRYLHFGTMAGYYTVLDRATGAIVREIDCGEPIFSTPVVGNGRAYFVTLGAKAYAVEPDGKVNWTWDFVREVLKFDGNRWDGADWTRHLKGRVTWKDHFVASRDASLDGKMLILPAGGRTVFLEDAGTAPRLALVGEIPERAGREYPATFGQSVGEDGTVYVQWHRRDNWGRVETLRLREGKLETSWVPGTQTAVNLHGLLGFSSVSLRGGDVYRVRPEEGSEFMVHRAGEAKPRSLGGFPSIASPILLKDQAVYGGLDGSLYVVPLAGGKPWSWKTAFGAPITAPAAVSGGRVLFGCEDGHLYVLGPEGHAPLPTQDLELWRIRSPLTGPRAGPAYDWYTNYGDVGCTNSNSQGIAPPLRLRWMRRVEGTVKHLPVCGGGRMYTHTAEGQVMAVEQDTGRLLWRRYWPGVYLSFTSAIYREGKILVPQAGLDRSSVRCLDASTGRLLWEAPFTGTPSWSRQAPPVVAGKLAIYASGSGVYAAQGSEKPFTFTGTPEKTPDGREVMSWLYTHDNPYYPKDNRPNLWAWDLESGQLVWHRDFSEYGYGGNDAGLCALDGKIYYSNFFGYSATQRKERGLPEGPNGITLCLDPATGETVWKSTRYYVTAGCALTGRDGRLYLGGWNPPDESTRDRYIFCLSAKDGALLWRSDPVASVVNVVTVGDKYIFSNASGQGGRLFDRETGKITAHFDLKYACTRFTASEPYLLGTNMDMLDLSHEFKLVWTGPAIDSRECLGSVASNGRIFYISQASGMEASLVAGEEARTLGPPWEKR
ncbi:MAG TPA: PQQ-binding-like beta-propeller repeat protein [Planctomycetota bacterium]|nr:PQQ-binding-like beta-propeller repeat protein [Planctomycetota bacterium]